MGCLAVATLFSQLPRDLNTRNSIGSVQQNSGSSSQRGSNRQVQRGGSNYDQGSRPAYDNGNRWRNSRGRRYPLRSDFPTWEVDSKFATDVFTFVRIRYASFADTGWWSRWDNDYPDGDWNFSYRLQQLTSMKVAPDSKVFEFTDSELLDYPFAYMAGVGTISLNEEEEVAMRRYLLNGGFIMMDDFWNAECLYNVKRAMRGVFPDREPEELTLDHPIFHNVYDLQALPQVVDIRTWRNGDSFEYNHGPAGGDKGPHFLAYFDDNHRMVALLCHNNDLGDGWEREGENHEYFDQFSEKQSYPFGINLITYVMTH